MAIRKRPEINKSKPKNNKSRAGLSKNWDETGTRMDRNDKPERFSRKETGNTNTRFKKPNGDEGKQERKYGSTASRKPENKIIFRGRKEDSSDHNGPVKKFQSSFKEGGRPTFKRNSKEGDKKEITRKYSSGHSRNQDTKTTGFPKTEKGGRTEERTPAHKFSKPTTSRFKKADATISEHGERRTNARPPKPRERSNEAGKRDYVKGGESREKRPASRFSKAPDTARPFERKRPTDSEGRKAVSRSPKAPFKREEAKPGIGIKRDYISERKPYENRTKSKVEEGKRGIENIDNVRLNRYISNAGICSRREADKLISTGLVSVNGKVITEMGYQVKNSDDVRFNGQRLSREKKVYIIMNKPKDAIATLDDPEGRNTVLDLLGNEIRERVFPVGRLDRNTTGVLLLTNDGEVAQRLMHPKYEVEKVYKATLDKILKGEDFWQLTNGVELEDGFIKPDEIAYPDPKNKTEVGILIHSGRNRIIHRMFEHLGYSLEKLDRVSYGGFVKTGLKRGEWRRLDDKEIIKLKRMSKLG